MVAYNFLETFETSIVQRRKRQTIRGDRKRHARPGELLQLLTGQRTIACRKLIPDPICTDIQPIAIQHGIVRLSDRILTEEEVLALAIADGFPGTEQFLAFFHEKHGASFEGFLICWSDRPDQSS